MPQSESRAAEKLCAETFSGRRQATCRASGLASFFLLMGYTGYEINNKRTMV
jgi:hypothetical protein